MTAPELMRAFAQWVGRQADEDSRARYWGRDVGSLAYPLYIGHPTRGTWYVRERLPGTRVWRAEEDGRFEEITLSQRYGCSSMDRVDR